MRMHLRLGLFLVIVSGVGCGARAPVPLGHVDDTQARLGTAIEMNLARLLETDRATLAKQVAQVRDIAQARRGALNARPPQMWFLPRQNIAADVLLHQAAFSSEAGFSLPSYHENGQTDAGLALHYARHGDLEAGRKLAPADDAKFASQLADLRTEKNYPVEWTQLVVAAQHLAELKLLDGLIEGATELALIHQQLTEVLEAKARTGPLGALLLPIGKQTLADAAAVWRTPGRLKTLLAGEIDTVLQGWGEIPVPQPLLVPGVPAAAVEVVFGIPARGHGVSIAEAEAVARAVDLLALPVAQKGIEGIVAFLDEKSQLREIQVSYAGKIAQKYPEPRHLAWPLVERGGEGKVPPPKAALPRAAFNGGPLIYDVTLIPRSNSLGAIVRVLDGKAEPLVAALPAEPLRFAPLNLDRTFETNRLALDRKQPLSSGPRLVVDKAALLAMINQPVRDPLPAEVVLEREKEYDVVRALHFRWKASQNVNFDAGSRIAGPLWAAYGPSTVEEHPDGDALLLRWSQGNVAYTLRLPYSDNESLNFAIGEIEQSAEALAKREKQAEAKDRDDRQQRLTERKPIERLERSHYLAGLKLGLSKDEVLQLVPRTQEWQRIQLDNSLVLVHRAAPNPAIRPTSWLRMLSIGFDDAGKVAQIRGLYTEGPAPSEPNNPGLFEALRQSHGEPEPIPATWSKVWTDLPLVGSPAQAFRWLDDRTVIEIQRDSFGAEVTVKDRPLNAPLGVQLAPLTLIGPGPDGCLLGSTRADLRTRWPAAPTMADGGMVLNQPTSSVFDALVVYFEQDRAVRVVGRLKAKLGSGAASLDGVLGRFYADHPTLGLLRRRIPQANARLLGGWGWHDDRVRVWAFGQETLEGPRVFVEWRNWPIEPEVTASR